jgi:hypothetical protein
LTPRLPDAILKKYFLKESKTRDGMKMGAVARVAAVLTGTEILVFWRQDGGNFGFFGAEMEALA